MSQAQQLIKRRRGADSDGDVDETTGRDGKRIKSLPIRSPPTYKQRPFFSRTFTPITQPAPALLTPVESSDDDIASSDLNFEPNQLCPLDDSHTSADGSISSVKVVVGDDGDMEMADSQPREVSSPQPWQRQRSNDMLAPPNIPHLLDIQHRQISERIPTPIYGHFHDGDVNMDMNGLGARSTTLLSPLIKEEDEAPWWHGHRLPSPVDIPDEIMTPISQAGEMMGRAHVENGGTDVTTRNETPFPALPDHEHSIQEGLGESFGGDFEAPRSRRLIMGVRGDCDKCRRKVPGHYSHILYA